MARAFRCGGNLPRKRKRNSNDGRRGNAAQAIASRKETVHPPPRPERSIRPTESALRSPDPSYRPLAGHERPLR